MRGLFIRSIGFVVAITACVAAQEPKSANDPAKPPISSTEKPKSDADKLIPVPQSISAVPIDQLPPPVSPFCKDGTPHCPPFYSKPVYGMPAEKRIAMMYNRMNEPDWYKYYRCTHYGYHPTHWAAWPEGWMRCRRPTPGPHPYDTEPVLPTAETREKREKELNGDEKMDKDSEDPLGRRRRAEPEKLGDENSPTLPRQLKKTGF